MAREGVQTVSAYQDRILHDAACMQRFLGTVGFNVTGMFRDPELMRCVREEIVPLLRTYPSSRVWVAGCATGEEVYALAVLLDEAGVLSKTSIYATDMNEDTLTVARVGSYPLDRARPYEDAHAAAGVQRTLSAMHAISG